MTFSHFTDLYWTAPELLHTMDGIKSQFTKTQNGDVYSYGIILHEILSRDEPYFQMEPKGTLDQKIIFL